MTRFICLATLAIACLTASTLVAQQGNPALRPIEDQPGLPRVLLIGDSISIGYTQAVRDELAGVTNLHRIPTNGGPTARGVEQIEAWLGDGKWDVIHFNWGLHDIKYLDAQGKNASAETGSHQVALEDYKKNLDSLVTRLKKTGATLVWATTTPVPEGANFRKPGDEVEYNAAALDIMQRHGVTVNDLYSVVKAGPASMQRPKDVHFTPEGSKALGKVVAQKIREALVK